MGALAIPELAAAVANAGGLGLVSMADLSSAEIAQELEKTRKLTSGMFGSNFVMPFMDAALVNECVEAAAAGDVWSISSTATLTPRSSRSRMRAGHWLAGRLAHARRQSPPKRRVAIACLAQGIEAGGHIRRH